MTPRILILAVVLIALTPADAYAYLDPGTGSFLIQGLIALLLGASMSVKIYWRKIKAVLTRRPVHDKDTDSDA